MLNHKVNILTKRKILNKLRKYSW